MQPHELPNIKQCLIADWEANWLAEDWSWEGLAKKAWSITKDQIEPFGRHVPDWPSGNDPLPNYYLLSVQDYWRPYYNLEDGTANLAYRFDMDDCKTLHQAYKEDAPEWYDHNGCAFNCIMKAAGHIRDVEELGGVEYHVAHIPQEFKTDIDWAILNRILKQRAKSGILQLDGVRLDGFEIPELIHNKTHIMHLQARQAHFSQYVGLDHLHYSKLNMEQCRFDTDAAFNSSEGSEQFSVRACIFLSQTYFKGDFDSDGSSFLGPVNIDTPPTREGLSLRNCQFYGPILWHPMTVEKWIFTAPFDFEGSVFNQKVKFQGAILSVFEPEEIVCNWTLLPPDPDISNHAFHDAQFKDSVHFKGFQMQAFGAFDGATFEKQVYLEPANTRQAKENFDIALKAANQPDATPEKIEANYRALENGSRTLQQVYEASGDKELAYRFHRQSLITRQKRQHIGKTDWVERHLSYAYGGISDYGNSILRPLLGVAFGLPCIMAVVLLIFVMGHAPNFCASVNEIPSHVLPSLELAYTNLFRPFALWDPRLVDTLQDSNKVVKTLLSSDSARGWRLSTLLLCALHNFASIALLFLMGLAARRRFQIG